MDGKKKLEELVAGLDGVTPGPWAVDGYSVDAVIYMPEGKSHVSDWKPLTKCATADGHWRHNAAHIARCDPDTIRSISDAYKAMEAERDALRAEAGELVVAQHRISALETAITRQVKNIERWIETGEPAGLEESKPIYEQLKSALEARHEG